MTAASTSRCAMRRARRELLDHVSIRLMHKPRGTLGAFPPPLAGRAIAFGADRLIPPPRSGGGSASEASRGGGTPPDPPRYARRATLPLQGRDNKANGVGNCHRPSVGGEGGSRGWRPRFPPGQTARSATAPAAS